VPAAPIIREEFGIASREVVTLTTAIYVLGLGMGPFVFAPISELYGRQTAYSVSMLGEGCLDALERAIR
jgi:MFS transporter, DHA1 family, multidrug resistance protein